MGPEATEFRQLIWNVIDIHVIIVSLDPITSP